MPITSNECSEAILASLASVPFGKICSYGVIAKLSGCPGKARYVAYILRNLPSDSKVPWHRIINSQGRIAFPEDSEKYQEQLKRLNDEGISMPLSKAKMRHYLWQGASVTVISKKPDNFQSESVKHSLDLRDSSK